MGMVPLFIQSKGRSYTIRVAKVRTQYRFWIWSGITFCYAAVATASEHSPRMQHTEMRYEVHILAVSTSSKRLQFAGPASENYCYFDNACPCITTQHVHFETFIMTLDWEGREFKLGNSFFFVQKRNMPVFLSIKGLPRDEKVTVVLWQQHTKCMKLAIFKYITAHPHCPNKTTSNMYDPTPGHTS